MESKTIYYYNGKPSVWWLFIFLVQVAALVAFLSMFGLTMVEVDGWGRLLGTLITTGIFLWILILWIRTNKTSIRITTEAIELFSEHFPDRKDVIPIADIFQVRYEDDFGEGHERQIYFYLKDGHQIKSKRVRKDRVVVAITGVRAIDEVIQILQFFQAQQKQIYISTNSKKMKKALNLENWSQPQAWW